MKDKKQLIEKLAEKTAEEMLKMREELNEKLDELVEMKAMNEHDARDVYASALISVLSKGIDGLKEQDEEDDDDTDDESEDDRDENEDSTTGDDCPMERLVGWFVKNPEVFEAIKTLRECDSVDVDITIHLDDELRSDDRS